MLEKAVLLAVACILGGLAQAAPCLVLEDEDEVLSAEQEAESLEQMRQALLGVGLILGPAPCEDAYRLEHRQRGAKLWISLVAPWDGRQILQPSSLDKRSATYIRLARSVRSSAPAVYLQAPGSLADSRAMILGDLTGRYDAVPEGQELVTEQSVAQWEEKKEEADRKQLVGGGGLMGGVTAVEGAGFLPTLAFSAISASGGIFSVKTGVVAALDLRRESLSAQRERCIASDYVLESLLAGQLSAPVGNGRPFVSGGLSLYAQCVEALGRDLGFAGPHLDAGWIFRNEGRVHPMIQASGNIPFGPFTYSDAPMPWVGLQAGLWFSDR